MIIPPYTIVDEGTDLLWKQFAQTVQELNWNTDDHTVLGLLPTHFSTRCVFAQNDEDGSFLGCVVWNEYDELAYLGFYIVAVSVRKCGLGTIMWTRALDRIRKTGLNLCLRSVPAMVSRYSAKDTPLEVSRMRKIVMTSLEMKEFCAKYPTSSGTVKLVSELSEIEKVDLIRFDQEITGRDRSALLLPYLAHSCMEGAVILNSDGKVDAWAAMTSTGFEKNHMCKLAPVYASSLSEFATLTQKLIPFCERSSSDAKIMVQILTSTVGEKELETSIGHPKGADLVTLTSEPFVNKLNLDKCYVPHNHNAHFDA